VRYTDPFGKVSYGYAHTGYVDITKGIISINGLTNGDVIPKDNHRVTGDIAYKEGIKEVNYYVNNIFIGRVDYGYLSDTSLEFEFDYPMQTGYQINIPAESWIQDQINVLKVEFVGLDNRREFEVRYLMPHSATSDEYVFERNSKSFHTYLKIETAKTNPAPQVWSPNGWMDATIQQTTEAMDPTYYVNHETYKYIFLDLGYNEGDYTVTTAQLDAILKDKGVLHGMGHVFRQAAIDFKVNPFYLIAHSLHETGNGNSRLALGQQMDYYHEIFGDENTTLLPLSETDRVKKWHNVYGIGAYDSNPILWGSERAYHEGWDTVEKAIYGGAEWIADGYIDRTPWAQNTLYKMRYNLKENMTHQYATDIMWAQNQSKTIKKQFDNMGVAIPLRFIIPSFGEIKN
jgi:beta-N-acetylglucosaminidase